MSAILIFLLTSLLITAMPHLVDRVRRFVLKWRARIDSTVFNDNYISTKAYYLKVFRDLPCVSYVGNIDAEKVFAYINEGNAGEVLSIHQRTFYNWQTSRHEFARTVFTIRGRVMIDVGDYYAEIYFDRHNFAYSEKLVSIFVGFKVAEKESPAEINIITLTAQGVDFKPLNISPQDLDVALYYNDDFQEVDRLIKAKLEVEPSKGIILLHGLPGTGKTTYLRHLVTNIKKKVLFVAPSVAGNLMNPEFIDLLIDNPNSVLVIEDAENILMDRKYAQNGGVSNLLNISDGLLSDCLNVQIICTFNSALSTIDTALLRKGRLIAKYEFGKLSVDKAQKLSDHLGFKLKVTRPMTLAEVANHEEAEFSVEGIQTIGFRRMEEIIEN